MNTFAKSLNENIAGVNLYVLDMLSELGKSLYMPKGIISQSSEAKAKTSKFNATLGIAASSKGPMYLDCLYSHLHDLDPTQIFTYAPSSGIHDLRLAWKEKLLVDNPSLKNKNFSLPVVTNAITHGLSIVADMFVDKDNYVVLPDKFWGNYRLTFGLRRGAEIVTYSLFNGHNTFNVEGLLSKVKECSKPQNKVIVILNFPNNPTGYTPNKEEMIKIADGLTEIAESGVNIVAIADDAYFGLFFDDTSFKESIFSLLISRSANLLPIKLDGATKEEFAWGLRVGFITFGSSSGLGDQSSLFNALETKVAGIIRANISNVTHLSQSIILKSIKHPEFYKQRQELNNIIKNRCLKVKSILENNNYSDEFTAYPFNSGYFMCIKLHRVNAESLRVYLLDKYQVGLISTNNTDIRIAFSSVEESDLDEMFSIIYKACKEI